MRLRELHNELQRLREDLNYKAKHITNEEKVGISGIGKLNQAILKLEKFGFIDKELLSIRNTGSTFLLIQEEEVIVNNGTYNLMQKWIEKIKLKTDAVIDAISIAIEEQKDNTISIKLPPYTDLKAVSKFIEDIDKIIKGVIPDKKSVEVKLTAFDSGSNWFEIILNSIDGVVIIGEFIRITVEFSKSILGSKKTLKQIEQSPSVDEEAKRVVLQTMKCLQEEQSRISAQNFINSGNINRDDITNINEYQEKLTKLIITMADYLIEGAEVKPALNAPEEQKEEFPKDEEYTLLQSSVNQLLLDSPIEEEVEPNSTIEEVSEVVDENE